MSDQVRQFGHRPPGRPVVASQEDAGKIPHGPSPSFDPRYIESIDGYDDTTKGYVESARSAFEVGQKNLSDLWEAMRNVSQSTAWSTDRKLIELAGAARRVQDRMLKAFQGASDTLNKAIAHLDSELSKPLDTGTVNTQQAGELRTMLRKEMTEKERAEFINTAIENNEARVIHPVLGAVPALSGLHPTLHAHYVRLYREKTAPELVRRLGVMRTALSRVDQVGPATFGEVETVLHQIEFDNTGPEKGVWDRIGKIEARYKAAKVALDKIP
jgi:hypothetical protein